MDYVKIAQEIHSQFYKSFTPNENIKCYSLQSKIFTSALLLIMLEKVLLETTDNIKNIQKILSKEIDNELFSDKELMRFARVEMEEQNWGVGWSAISRNIKFLNKINISISEGSLRFSMPDFQDILYCTYKKPLSSGEEDDYFSRFPLEFLKYKEIFLADYSSIRETIRDRLV